MSLARLMPTRALEGLYSPTIAFEHYLLGRLTVAGISWKSSAVRPLGDANSVHYVRCS
jgi:hypothetical protein